MTVDPKHPFIVAYSLYHREFLGYSFLPFVVKLNKDQSLSLTYQKFSTSNASDFASQLKEDDYEIIKLLEELSIDKMLNFFCKNFNDRSTYFQNVFFKKKNELVIFEINSYINRRLKKIIPLFKEKNIYEMGIDGYPVWKKIDFMEQKAKILFHFRKNETNTHYFPTIKLGETNLDFRGNDTHIITSSPAWVVLEQKLFTFEKNIDAKILKPFQSKKFILIPRRLEDEYYRSFVVNIIKEFDVYAVGFDIKTIHLPLTPILRLKIISFENQKKKNVLFKLSFQYGDQTFDSEHLNFIEVKIEKKDEHYTFYRIQRDNEKEKQSLNLLRELKFEINKSTNSVEEALSLLKTHNQQLLDFGFKIEQDRLQNEKKYFLGSTSIEVKIDEKIDWFEVHSKVLFGEYEIPFKQIRNLILQGKNEINLPNGEIGLIPDSWFEDYHDLFNSLEVEENGMNKLLKYHLGLVSQMQENKKAFVSIDEKLKKLLNFNSIDDKPMPMRLKGQLRDYQKSCYNWLHFLNEYNFGGCLADDMGLGKTIQTLAMLQYQFEQNPKLTNLLVVPTSLIFNWQLEVEKFAPEIKVYVQMGQNRDKDITIFSNYQLIITSYGTLRSDIDFVEKFYFNYTILDESQNIKNPNAQITQAVCRLKSKHKLILSGTPIENSTNDLWSQFSFINPGLLGTRKHFQREFLIPIERQKDKLKTLKLNAIVKPFILRRDKTQVAKDLPDKVIQTQYCVMSEAHSAYYEKEKVKVKKKILSAIDELGENKSKIIVLQALMHLRQIANHPLLVDEDYKGDSGKFNEMKEMLHNILESHHKVLIFSSFVKHLKVVSEYLQSKRIKFSYIDGQVKNRKEEVESFQNGTERNVFLLSLKAGGTGLNLTKADYVFILDPWWNPAAENQAIDRAHRIGQVNKVFTYKFISKDTLEEKILKLQESKMKLSKELISTDENIMKELTKSDIDQLFD